MYFDVALSVKKYSSKNYDLLTYVGRSNRQPESREVSPLFAVFAVAVEGRRDVNVELNRPSYQISTWSGFQAGNANDDNHGTDFFGTPCSSTDNAVNPWWAVDLLVPLYVAGVLFVNRDNTAGQSGMIIGYVDLLMWNVVL